MREVNEAGLAIIKHYEQGPGGGHAKYAYICPAGKPTIGWGHVIRKGETFRTPMTLGEADALLKRDLEEYAGAVERLVRVPLTDNQFSALVSFVYNIGVNAFEKSTMLRKLNAGDFSGAADCFDDWVFSTVGGKKVKLNGLVARRNSEEELFERREVTKALFRSREAVYIPDLIRMSAMGLTDQASAVREKVGLRL